MIFVDSKKKSEKTLQKLYPNAVIADVTSKAPTALVRLSPFYPHGNIPVPFSNGLTSQSVEGVWQGLKVFQGADIDIAMFHNSSMKNIKRTVRTFGIPLGHRKGVNSTELLPYLEARIQIYLPTYRWVLENKVKVIIDKLRVASQEKDIVLLDYDTNEDVFNPKKPLSHAQLIKMYVEGNYPSTDVLLSKLKAQSKKLEPKVERAELAVKTKSKQKPVSKKPRASSVKTPKTKADEQIAIPF
ncbi:hypothetical protein J2I47_10625 [Fibrella sp. HMF5335]|uniref:Uncharacterized protein n=1 Tax=Fibrella rubiginis TaxID=2817060 RepID=A0A939K350_9BACT|nr:hypothetical protein [Fibrella rubiginis]MBO0936999.1 hypothetical protein [Fibrella rubiginis]